MTQGVKIKRHCKKSRPKKRKNQWTRQKQDARVWLEEDEGATALRLKKQIILRNVFDAESVQNCSGVLSEGESFTSRLCEELQADYFGRVNPAAKKRFDQIVALQAKKCSSTPQNSSTSNTNLKKPITIEAFLGAYNKGFVIVRFEDGLEAELYRNKMNGTSLRGLMSSLLEREERTIRADFHDGVDLKTEIFSRRAAFGKSSSTAALSSCSNTSVASETSITTDVSMKVVDEINPTTVQVRPNGSGNLHGVGPANHITNHTKFSKLKPPSEDSDSEDLVEDVDDAKRRRVDAGPDDGLDVGRGR